MLELKLQLRELLLNNAISVQYKEFTIKKTLLSELKSSSMYKIDIIGLGTQYRTLICVSNNKIVLENEKLECILWEIESLIVA